MKICLKKKQKKQICLSMQFLFPNLVIAVYIIACLDMCYSFARRLLSKVETRRDSSFALYIMIINCIDE